MESLPGDSDYFSEANIEYRLKEEILIFINTHRDGHNQSVKERFSDPEPLT